MPRLFCGPSPGQSVATTLAPWARAISAVPSVLPESSTITSSAKRAERTHSPMLIASFLATMMTLSVATA